MADTLDPATMDALNQLGDEIEAQAGADAPKEAADPIERPEAEPAEDAAPEAPEGQEAASENAEGEQGEGEEPVTADKPRRTQKDKDVQRLLRDRFEARNKVAEAEARAADLQRQIEELKATQQRPPDPAPAAPVIQRQGESGQDFEARVQVEASRRAKASAFDEACNKVATKGIEVHKDFTEAQGALVGAFGRQINARPEFLQAIVRLDNGHDVFHHLGKNLEEADALFANAEPVDLIMQMKEISAKLKTPKPQRVSNAPAPVNPIRGGANGNRSAIRLDDDKADMDSWKNQFFKELAS